MIEALTKDQMALGLFELNLHNGNFTLIKETMIRKSLSELLGETGL